MIGERRKILFGRGAFRALAAATLGSILAFLVVYLLYGGTGAFECSPCTWRDDTLHFLLPLFGWLTVILVALLLCVTAAGIYRERRSRA
jgi:ABC-type antimicrobial peptide transport system permease subunit